MTLFVCLSYFGQRSDLSYLTRIHYLTSHTNILNISIFFFCCHHFQDSQRRCSGGTHQVERLSKRPLSLTPERPQEFQRSEAAIVDSRGGTSGTDSGCGVQREERQRGSDVAVRSCSDSESTDINVYRVRVAELENDLQDARQAAQLGTCIHARC